MSLAQRPAHLSTCPEACPVVGVSALLFSLMGGGDLAQSSKITAQGETESWKHFVELVFNSFPPHV